MNTRNPSAKEEAVKAAVRRELEADRIELLMQHPFIGVILMATDLIPVCDSRLRTACTDGSRIFVGIEYYRSLKKEFRLFVLAHEIWHIVYLHFLRKQNRDHARFNCAADLEIHFMLVSEGIPVPHVLPHDPAWEGLPAEEIYEFITAPKPVKSQHFYPDTGVSKVKCGKKAGGGKELIIDPEFSPHVASNIAETTRQRVIVAAQQTERTQGYLPYSIKALVQQYLHPQIRWQELRRQFVSSCFGGRRRWLPPNRRHIWQNLYLQSRRDEFLRCVVAIDTSGSTADDLPQFFAELTSLMRSFGRYELTVIQCDADIQSVEQYDENSPPPPRWNAFGGGGTSFHAPFAYVAREKLAPALLIYITDGYGDAPREAPPYPVLWLLTHDAKPNFCDWGTKITLEG